jgi:hypothetical protein
VNAALSFSTAGRSDIDSVISLPAQDTCIHSINSSLPLARLHHLAIFVFAFVKNVYLLQARPSLLHKSLTRRLHTEPSSPDRYCSIQEYRSGLVCTSPPLTIAVHALKLPVPMTVRQVTPATAIIVPHALVGRAHSHHSRSELVESRNQAPAVPAGVKSVCLWLLLNAIRFSIDLSPSSAAAVKQAMALKSE